MDAPDTITLGSIAAEVVIPDDLVTARELCTAAHMNPMRAMCAIVGLCCPSLGLVRFYEGHGFSVGRYGAYVWRALLKRGATEGQILDAGEAIYPAVLHAAYPSEEEIDAAVGFSSPTAGSPSSNPSSAPASGDNPIPTGSGA